MIKVAEVLLQALTSSSGQSACLAEEERAESSDSSDSDDEGSGEACGLYDPNDDAFNRLD